MDERQTAVKRTFTKEQLEGMSVEDLVALVGAAGTGAKYEGTGVVKRKDGSIRYAKEAVPGAYFESTEDLKRNAEVALASSETGEQ